MHQETKTKNSDATSSRDKRITGRHCGSVGVAAFLTGSDRWGKTAGCSAWTLIRSLGLQVAQFTQY